MRRRTFVGLVMASQAAPPDPLWVVAHRGAMRMAPENTIAAYERAAAAGADLVEVDVRATADGALVLLHDATLDRTTDGKGPVAERTLAEVRRLRPEIPTFGEVLAWGQQRGIRIDVDHKAGPVAAVAEAIRQAGMVDRVVVEGPRERLVQFAGLLPGVETMAKVTSVADVGAACRLLRTHVVRLSLTQLWEAGYVEAVRAAGARVAVTLLGANDHEEQMRSVVRQGARIIETDYPEVAARLKAV